jgi:chemotaxis protein CheY-P-specific phosphatase CheC
MTEDMAGAILSFSAVAIAKEASDIMVIKTSFQDVEQLLNGMYLLMLDQGAYGKLIKAIGELV